MADKRRGKVARDDSLKGIRDTATTPSTPTTRTTPTTPAGRPRGERAVPPIPQVPFSSPPVTPTGSPTPQGTTQVQFSTGRNDGYDDYVDDGWRLYHPTNTINPPRPRTLAATYSIRDETVYLCFRGNKRANGWADGAIYEYQNVSPAQWAEIKRTASTGRYINAVLNHHPYTRIS